MRRALTTQKMSSISNAPNFMLHIASNKIPYPSPSSLPTPPPSPRLRLNDNDDNDNGGSRSIRKSSTSHPLIHRFGVKDKEEGSLYHPSHDDNDPNKNDDDHCHNNEDVPIH